MGRRAGYSRKNYNYRMDPYIDGNTVRQPAPVRQPVRRRTETIRPDVSRSTRRNRERALQLNLAYVTFLAIAAVITLSVCVRFLQQQSTSTSYRKSIASLEGQFSALKMENDAENKRIQSSVNLEDIKDIAINKLGMVYPREGQVYVYNSQSDQNYMRQFEDVPTE